MHITIVTGPFLSIPPSPCGAVEQRWYYVAQEFVKMGHEVTFVSKRANPGQRDETISGVRHIHVAGSARSALLGFNLLLDLLYSLRALFRIPKCDVIVTNVFWLPALLSLFRQNAGRVTVNVARFPKRQMWLYRRVARLVGVSSAIRDAIIEQQPELAPKTTFIPNPVDISVFSPPAAPMHLAGNRTILYCGRLHREKGLAILINAVRLLHAKYPDLRLRIVGPWTIEAGGGGADYRRSLMETAKSLPVEFVEPIYDRPALAKVLQEAYVFCYPSLAEKGEGFGCAPLEAMAAGTVPVVSMLDVFSDFVTPGETGLMFDHRAKHPEKELAAAISTLLDDPEETAMMADEAVRRAQFFSLENVARQYVSEFEAILDLQKVPAQLPPGAIPGTNDTLRQASQRLPITARRSAQPLPIESVA